jgi:hypothetical protein
VLRYSLIMSNANVTTAKTDRATKKLGRNEGTKEGSLASGTNHRTAITAKIGTAARASVHIDGVRRNPS